MNQWWNLDINETAEALASDLSNGLSSLEAANRLEKYGPNQLAEKKVISPFKMFLEQFRDFIIWVLITAAIVSGFLREWIDALAIIAIVILNALLAFIQEYRAEKSLAALRTLSSPVSKVIRDGHHKIIQSNELVIGDLIEFEAGDSITADCRLAWQTSNFSIQEASLTGESTPVTKTILALEEKDVPLPDRANMVYMGTSVVSGKARALVVATGMNTELGTIAGLVSEIKREQTPLQKKLEQFGKWIVYLCFVLVGLVLFMELLRGGKIIDVFLTAVSLAVAAIPEGLPAVVTITLALGVHRMVRRNALVRRLPAVETLGCTTVICSDKTGTLTRNEMTVQAIYAGGRMFRISGAGYEPKGEFFLDKKAVDPRQFPDLEKFLTCAAACNSAQLIKDKDGYRIAGDPTEAAILTASAKANILKNEIEKQHPFVDEIPFDSERKKMTIIRKSSDRFAAFVKGAPDILLNDCTKIEENGTARDLTAQDKQSLFTLNASLADEAMRILAVAYRDLSGPEIKGTAGSIERNLTFVGLVAMIDPPRLEVRKAIEECKTAGIKTVMITGDHKNTAIAIARDLGFFEEGSLALTGEELDKMDDEKLYEKIDHIPVFARVSPEHKLRIVRCWRKKDAVVAMTGDGVNDAPAVKEADIGVAMGITGTDVTKEVSDMVITDDNFASIAAAVEEGRGIYDNIKKFINYLLSCNAGEILTMFFASLFGMPIPLLPIHILWVNLVTDGLPALALGVDPAEPDIMKRPPRPPNEKVITSRRVILILIQGAFIALCSLSAFAFVLYIENEGLGRARTAAFIVLSCSQLFHSFNCRSLTQSIFKTGIFTNSKLIAANGVSFLVQMAAVYVPFLQVIFKTEPLTWFDWALVISLSSLPLWMMELVKKAKLA